MRWTLSILCAITTFFTTTYALPSSLVVNSDGSPRIKRSGKEGGETGLFLVAPQIYQMYVKSNVSNRFVHTTVVSKVKNVATQPQEATFSIVLPENAFISGFIMEIDNKNYTAYVNEKEEAKKTYDRAVSQGLGAAHVAVSARDSNRFTVSVNVEPETKAAFYLTYEELLKRQDGRYELVINLHPGQPVKDLSVEILIAESRKITNLKAPPIRSGNEIGSDKEELDPRADLQIVNDTTAIVRFSPNVERQKQLAHFMGTKEEEGLSGQFVVQYDVERDPRGGEVLVRDGYFVHFFAPSELPPLPKHVVFVLDTSSSMYNRRIQQLREAMLKILDQLNDIDLFHLVEFNTKIRVWNLDNSEQSVWYPSNENGWYNREEVNVEDLVYPHAYPVNADNIKKAKNTVSQLVATASTDIYSALKVGLHLVEITKTKSKSNHQPIIMFLTDGEPTVGVTSTERIINEITEYNSGVRKAPIFALSFGKGADKKFLQKLALRNSGFSKHIYEASDASLQLQDFYQQISSPLLANVSFKYESSVSEVTKTEFPLYFRGSEIIVSGCIDLRPIIDPGYFPDIDAWNGHKIDTFKPEVKEATSSIERLWAYLTIRQLLDKKEISDDNSKEIKQKALDLALKYSFVTPVSSLVVVKPNVTSAVDTEAAEKDRSAMFYGSSNNRNGAPLYSPRTHSASTGIRPASVPVVSDYNEIIGLRADIDMPTYHTAGFSGLPSQLLPISSFDDDDNGFSYDRTLTFHHVQDNVTPKKDLFAILPWLKNFVKQSEILSTSKGDYKLGLNEKFDENVMCPKTPLNTVGHCSLIHQCSQIHSYLTDITVLEQHFCVLKNEYAGVCCPNVP